MWTPEAVAGLLKSTIITWFVATFIYNVLMGFAASMLKDDE